MRALGDGLVRAGLAEAVMDTDTLTLQYREFGQLIADLRATGTTNASSGRQRGLTGRKAWMRLAAAYEQQRDAGGMLPATVEIVFGQAWAPGAARRRRSPGDEFAIALDSIGRRPSGQV
jgi:malonyl-CoA O-methyltransferase